MAPLHYSTWKSRLLQSVGSALVVFALMRTSAWPHHAIDASRHALGKTDSMGLQLYGVLLGAGACVLAALLGVLVLRRWWMSIAQLVAMAATTIAAVTLVFTAPAAAGVGLGLPLLLAGLVALLLGWFAAPIPRVATPGIERYDGPIVDGKRHGTQLVYDSRGELQRIEQWDMGMLSHSSRFSTRNLP